MDPNRASVVVTAAISCRRPLQPARPTNSDVGKFMVAGQELDREESRKARMLYDYDAVNDDEISINAGEVSGSNQHRKNGRPLISVDQ